MFVGLADAHYLNGHTVAFTLYVKLKDHDFTFPDYVSASITFTYDCEGAVMISPVLDQDKYTLALGNSLTIVFPRFTFDFEAVGLDPCDTSTL